MQFSLTPQTLAQMDNVPLQYTGMALDSLDRMKAADQTGLADLENLNAHNAAMRPMLQEHQGLQNASMATRIPGEAADAQMRARKNANEELLNPESIQAMREKYSDDKLTHHINQLAGTGSLMMAAAEHVWNAPLGGHMAARQMFEQAGLGSKWQPEWDNLRPEQLAMRLHNAGQELVTIGSKAQQALQSAQLKGDYANQKALLEMQARERMNTENNQTRRDLAAAMLSWKTQFNHQSTDQLIASLTMRMNAAQDPAIKAEFNQQIRYLQSVLEKIKTQPGVTGSIDSEGKLHLVNKKDQTGSGGTGGLPAGVSTSNWDTPTTPQKK